MSRKNRTKGLAFERECARALSRAFPGARRQLEFHSADAKGVDLQGTGPYKIQCKKTKKYVPLSTIGEIQCERAFGDVPVLIAAGDAQEPLVCLPLKEFVRLVEKDLGTKQAALFTCFRCSKPVPWIEGVTYAGHSYCAHCCKHVKSKA